MNNYYNNHNYYHNNNHNHYKMPQINIFIGSEENYILEHFKLEWKISKMEVIKQIILEYGKQKGVGLK